MRVSCLAGSDAGLVSQRAIRDAAASALHFAFPPAHCPEALQWMRWPWNQLPRKCLQPRQSPESVCNNAPGPGGYCHAGNGQPNLPAHPNKLQCLPSENRSTGIALQNGEHLDSPVGWSELRWRRCCGLRRFFRAFLNPNAAAISSGNPLPNRILKKLRNANEIRLNWKPLLIAQRPRSAAANSQGARDPLSPANGPFCRRPPYECWESLLEAIS